MEVANELTVRGLPSKPYHAALSASVRAETQSQWMDGHIAIIVATISFGMGVDKSNVRCFLLFLIIDFYNDVTFEHWAY